MVKPDVEVAVQQHVRGLDVAVQHVGTVQVGQPGTDLPGVPADAKRP